MLSVTAGDVSLQEQQWMAHVRLVCIQVKTNGVISEAARALTTFATDLVVLSMGIFDFTVENSTLASRPWKDGKDFWCSFELYPDWKGSTFYVFKGVAHHRREYLTATEVVVKTFRHVDAITDHWKLYKDACAVSRKMATEFNNHLSRLGSTYKVWFVTPADVVMDNISDVMTFTRFLMRFQKSFSEDEIVIFEDYLDGDFKTFISPNGSTCENGSDILDSFCHFVYHQSGGELVLGNLKGVFENNCYRLTCPVIHSKTCTYGPEDKGESGIHEFFSNHVCTRRCQDFLKPEKYSLHAVPSAPPYVQHSDHTDTKEPCDTNDSNTSCENTMPFEFMAEPPKYATVDPNQPPSYESCIGSGLRNRKTAASETTAT